MNSMFRSGLLLSLSLGAGLAAQQLFTDTTTEAADQEDPASAARLPDWSSAETFYASGRAGASFLAPSRTSEPSRHATSHTARLPDAPSIPWQARSPIADGDRPTLLAQADGPFSAVQPPSAEGVEPDLGMVRRSAPPPKRVSSEQRRMTEAAVDDAPGVGLARTPSPIAPPLDRAAAPPANPVPPQLVSSPYLDARALIRLRAARKAEERLQRIELRKWLGYTPLRPSVGALPFTEGPAAHPTIYVAPYYVTPYVIER